MTKIVTNPGDKARQCGFSVVELMIALVLGLIVSGSVIGVFLSANRNFAQDERLGRLQQNARFAMDQLASDLQMAAFWGRARDPGDVIVKTRDCMSDGSGAECQGIADDSILTLGADCDSASTPHDASSSYNTWAYDVLVPVQVLSQATDTEAADAFACITAAEFGAGSDVLAVKYATGHPLDRSAQSSAERDADAGEVFLRSTGEIGALLVYQDDVPPAGQFDWRYVAHIYYIQTYLDTPGDGIPSLYRKRIEGASMVTETGGVAEGVEAFHVMFGIDTSGDGAPNTYISEPTAAQLAAAVTAKIYVLARSATPDPAYSNDRTHTLGDITIAAANDNFYRRVFSSTVMLRNPANLARLLN